VLKRKVRVNFHTPNALNARFVNSEVARLMVEAGFKCIYLGFESSAYEWQKKTGGKVYSDELARAVDCLVSAGADPAQIHAYLIVAHPLAGEQHVEDSMRYANSLGIEVMLSEFSPIPGTPDGEACRRRVDLDEPLSHNKTAFAILSLGETEMNRLKSLASKLNQQLDGFKKGIDSPENGEPTSWADVSSSQASPGLTFSSARIDRQQGGEL
jgi:radical SAM superfamily enzyme YgiQ (UPF0313 family)